MEKTAQFQGSSVDDIFGFIEFAIWFVQATYLGLGLILGSVLTLLVIPLLYRHHRRIVLRRGWKKNRPLEVTEGLHPEWGPYDPDTAGIGKKCICHNRQMHPGERVLMWPEVGPLNVLHMAVYCESVRDRLWDER